MRPSAWLPNREIRALSRRWGLAFLSRERGPNEGSVDGTVPAVVAPLNFVLIVAGFRDDLGCLGLCSC
jgi:hypothetical protein